ncbi:RNA-binding protein MEX3D [Amphibalanus amphitrite]|uniref:RNA-binding protein MEX3D n=1 Tax=Amphibalanus amphitrite TaxID=1232801 RepID=A0A6A4VCG9_AMPAM|nr:RNA-binding protein MEX3B-like [Amphibalanus amphitrite]KAF0290839.1 RNA-binding protein MEX3D [Amphibalanus amphitrite]
MELVGMGKIENYRSGRYGGMSRDGGHGRDCGVVDTCSQYYRSYLRAVRWLAEECDKYYDDPQLGMDRIIKEIMLGRISPNNDDYVILVPLHGQDRHFMSSGIRVEEKTARLIREVQRDFDLQNDAKYFGQFKTACGKSLDQVRQQFYIDCFSECIHPQSSRMKANTTECVPVPSSEHVAEIVGKKGGKIKNIRAETNTYIKTPKRDEEPVFVITGRKEDVAFAKQKILAAAEHFSQLREARRQNPGGPAPALGPPKRDGDVTIQVEVPYEFVGLVVGQKGATIKRIQQDTNTYITTPSRRHRPIFEVVGQPDDVETAREAITAHISSRVDKFRSEAAAAAANGPPGGPTGYGGATSIGSFLGIDDSAFATPPAGAESGMFGSYGNTNLGGTWTGVPPPSMPPPVHRYAPPPPPPPPAPASGSRLSAFRNLQQPDGLETLSASLRELALADPWQSDSRGRTASLPADPADAPCSRRGSEESTSHALDLLFSRPGPLGWDAGVISAPLPAAKGSSETLNSDSGVETTTPPPLDGFFGPIGSKRTSPTAALLGGSSSPIAALLGGSSSPTSALLGSD